MKQKVRITLHGVTKYYTEKELKSVLCDTLAKKGDSVKSQEELDVMYKMFIYLTGGDEEEVKNGVH